MDTGFWFARIDRTDRFHEKVSQYRTKEHIIVPLPVITETAYLVLTRSGVESLALFSQSLATSKLILEPPVAQDYTRTAEILRKYNDNNIDFVDACIVAMAERLNITKILTVDHRHFRMFKPKHCKSFELFPEKL